MFESRNKPLIHSKWSSPQGSAIYLPFIPLIRRHAEELKHAFTDDWDGEGAAALSEAILLRAERLIGRYGLEKYIVEMSPSADGSLSVVWEDAIGNYVYLGVGPGETIHVYYNTIADGSWEGVALFSDAFIIERLAIGLKFVHPSAPEDDTYRANQKAAIRFVSKVA